MQQLLSRFLSICGISILCNSTVSAQTWEPITDPAESRALFSDTEQTADIKQGVTTTARYNADGTGELEAWNGTFPREWKVEDDGQICILISGNFDCFRIEKNLEQESEYRGTNTSTGESVVFNVSAQTISSTGMTPNSDEGGPGAPSADELAAALANPTNPVMTLGNNFDFIKFNGDLPGANEESSFRYVFQTSFPFKLSDGGTVFFRPALPVLFNDPIPSGEGSFSSEGTDIGDVGFDFSYGKTSESGLLYGGGLVGTIPTASNDLLGKDKWGLGPEVLLGIIRSWGVVGGILAHQWDIAGSGDAEINTTSLNYFYAVFLKDGWQIAAGPSISYDHTKDSDDAWTLPLGIGLSKTAILGGRPWKFQIQYWNYVESASAFSPEHQIRLSINPVLSAPWNKGR